MSASEFTERFARLGPTRRGAPVQSGSTEIVTIRADAKLARIETVPAIAALRESGLTLLRAKRVIESILADGSATIELPNVFDHTGLRRKLAKWGFVLKVREKAMPDVQSIRETLGLTQEQFALKFGLELDAVRNWEHKRRTPDTAARSLLRVIARFPEAAAAALEG